MYIPTSFLETDLAVLHDFMQRHSFATLISSRDGEPFASHLPLLLNRHTGAYGTLTGHMARANPHWESAADQRVLAIFHGPHAYVSPGWMEDQNVVPTWNYVTVHAYGTLRLIEDRDRLQEVLLQTVSLYESNRESPWSMSAPEPGFLDKLLGGIVGFEIEIDRLEGKWKLNQNHPAERRQRIMRGLRETGRHDEALIADLMERSATGDGD